MPNSDRVYISIYKNDFRTPALIEGTDVYFESNLSSYYKLILIKKLVEIFELDFDDFIVYCRDTNKKVVYSLK